MKKETIFKHELNESSQAKATLNCLSNRNKKHLKESIGEVYPDSRWGEKERLNGPNGMSKSERDILIKLEQIMPNLVQKAMSKTADHDNPEEIKKLVLNMIMQGNLMQKLGDKVGASWKEFSMGFKSEIINLVKNEFAKHEEQEEFEDDFESEPQISAKNVFDVKFKHSPLKNSVSPMVKHAWGIIYNRYGDGLDRALYMGGADDSEILEVFKSYEKYSKDAHDLVSKLLGHKRINEEEELTAEQEETTPPWVGRKYNGGIDFDADGNLQVITPDEDDDDDYEAPPLFDSEQERHDITLATTYCLGESFIDNDGDLDDIYYAVLKYFDSTYDAPETADYEDVLKWCKKHYKQIENLITTEEQEEQIFKVRTKQGFVEVPLSSEVVDAFHDNLDPRYEDMDTQAALKGINGGARLAALIAGMMEQGYKPTPAENHILELHYNAKKAVKQSQDDSSNRNINAYSD